MAFKRLREEIDGMMARDPAARSRLEVVLCYPGFHAIVMHRLAHRLWRRGWRLSARALSQLGRAITGIEIHPGARIGRGFFIDHGMGVVVGETSIIGDDVTLYHGVTLGGIAPSVDSDAQVGQKRHPTIEDEVIVGSGAQVLGPITVGSCARVGANAVVVKDVPAGATVVGIPARIAAQRQPEGHPEFVAYGTPTDELPDPVARAMTELAHQVDQVKARLQALEQELERGRAGLADLPLEPKHEDAKRRRPSARVKN